VSGEIEVRHNGAPLVAFDDERLQLLKDQICPDLTDGELAVFAEVCQRVSLDPFARQIYAVKRYNKQLGRKVMTVQTSIDGFRLIAQRTGEYAGQVGPYWCGTDGEWKDVWLSSTAPAAAKVGILRRGFAEPLWAVARFDAYAQRGKDGLTLMWASMGDVMSAKCAEALGLRRAFPQELSGLYTSDEMAQADNAQRDAPSVPSLPVADDSKTISQPNIDALTARCEELGIDVAEVVKRATNGETDNPAAVKVSEVGVLRDACAAVAAEVDAYVEARVTTSGDESDPEPKEYAPDDPERPFEAGPSEPYDPAEEPF
jgi:phage recombination protein Bet